MEIRAAFHFSWVYTFSATLSSLRNWAHNDRYRLRPNTPAQLCWSSSRLQPLQNYNLIKFAIIRPSTLNHDRHLWNFRGAPDETTSCRFFSVSQRLNFIFAWNCLMFVPINSLSLSLFGEVKSITTKLWGFDHVVLQSFLNSSFVMFWDTWSLKMWSIFFWSWGNRQKKFAFSRSVWQGNLK